ncbi:signal transduction histidine kinase [Mesorhizobium soli]|uniref:sensor histidine kinase n=1 Tax=Pseudaminobacter soli (ex Li et al. 2025) TaxID=1295366 RepID=UPI0024753375|nr:sensor histidine kinase [Mesorhizobium soli]MDH6233179.1 signal transduction histidine kinase [Mesorhizobium soli]
MQPRGFFSQYQWAMMLCALLFWLPGTACAIELNADTPRLSLEGRLAHFVDTSNALSFEDISRPGFAQQNFTRLPDFRSLGYDAYAHWFHVELNPAPNTPPHWILAIGSPELESVDVWVEKPRGGFQRYAMGYHRPYSNRPVQTRLFTLPVDVFPGAQVYFRVRTTNAINVYANLWQGDAFAASETRSNFYRGLYFGILLIAVALYTLLGARLRDVVMAAYAGYIASQLLFNLGTNGYLPVLLTRYSGWLTDTLPRIGWLGGAAAIVLMWDRLLDLKRTHRRIYHLYRFTLLLNLALLPFALLPFLVRPWLLVFVELVNILNNLNLAISMVLLLMHWRRSRQRELMIYFAAFVIPVAGSAVNTAMNLGLLPQNAVTGNLYQIATLVHILVMSYGLTLRLRQLQYDKVAAVNEATIARQRSEEQRRFVAMLSHEFGNPLAAIDRAAQMIQLKTPELAPAEMQRLSHIRGNAATLSRFVDNFLMTEALGHGALALSRGPYNIRSLLDDTIRLKDEAVGTRIQINECPADASFNLDPTLMSVAIRNLLANALRYSPPESPVIVSVVLDDEGLRIRIADQGPGMSDAELEQLGTPYFRARSSLGKQGSGLGYHFTRCIVETHGGTLVARSAGPGLEVEIFLP